MKWTADQQQAIDAPRPGSLPSQTLLVAAAAGSGKTAVLVERIIQRLQDKERPLSIRELLVVTFTKAAAAEMSARIGAKLAETFDETGDPYLEEQLRVLPSAHISTLHSFCQWVIRSYFYRLDIDPSFRIGNEGELTLLKAEVMDAVFRQAYKANGYHIFDLADMFGDARSDVKLQAQILRLYNFAMAQSDPMGWLDRCQAMYEDAVGKPLLETAWGQGLWQDQQEALAEILAAQEEFRLLTERPDGPTPWQDNVQNVQYLLDGLQAAKTWQAMHEAVKAISGHSFKAFRKAGQLKKDLANGVVDEGVTMRAETLGKAVKSGLEALAKGPFTVDEGLFQEQLKEQIPIVQGLVGLTKAFADAFAAAKRDGGLLDFSDLEHLCLQLLSTRDENGNMVPSEVALELRDQFKEVMVDEYQDTNGVQEAIVNLVSRKDNRFYVGDVKQSIYRFRMADPTLFLAKYKTYDRDLNAVERRIDLAKNFRSDANILRFTNFVFRQIMTEAAAELTYGDEEALYPGREVEDAPDSWVGGPVELHLLEVATEDDDEDGEGGAGESLAYGGAAGGAVDAGLAGGSPAGDAADAGANGAGSVGNAVAQPSNDEREIAFIIEKLLELKAEGATVQDKDGSFRPMRWRDVVILLRSVATKASRMVEALRAAGIPAYAEENTGYFGAIEIKLMLSLLQVIDNPEQDLPMAAVLGSPFVGMNADELGRLRQSGTGSLWSLLPAFAKAEDNESLAAFVAQFERWRTFSRRRSVSELIRRIYEDMNYVEYVSAMPNGLVRRANVEALYDRARQYEAGNFRGLFRFLRFLESLQDAGQDLGVATTVSEADDVVRIMSIHKSKGLEFPVVFLASMQKKFNSRDLTETMLLHKDGGIGLKGYYPEYRVLYGALPWLYARGLSDLAAKAEEERILYVAMTRARDKLFLTGYVKNFASLCEKEAAPAMAVAKGELPKSLITSAVSYLDWLIMSLSRHIDGNVIRVNSGVEDGELADIGDKNCRFTVTVHDGMAYVPPTGATGETAALLKAVRDLAPVQAEPLPDDIVARFGFTYDYPGAVRTAAKISVSEIKRRFAERDEEAERLTVDADELPMVAETVVPFGSESVPVEAADSEAFEASLFGSDPEASSEGSLFDTDVPAPVDEEADNATAPASDAAAGGDDAAVAVPAMPTDGLFAVKPLALQHEEDLRREGAAWGTLMHEAMQWLPVKAYTKASLKAELDRLAVDGYFTPEERARLHEGMLLSFFTSPLGKRMLAAPQTAKEWPFSMLYDAKRVYDHVEDGEKLFLQGIIDTAFREDDGWVLVDYKTDRVANGDELRKRYASQLTIYREALATLTGEPVKETYIYSFRLREAVPIK